MAEYTDLKDMIVAGKLNEATALVNDAIAWGLTRRISLTTV